MKGATLGKARRPMRGCAAIVMLAFGLSACVGPAGPGPKSQVGAATGAAAGGLIGAAAGGETEGILAGVLLGGLLGGAVGNALDNADREHAQRAAYHALEWTPSGTASRWRNPDSGRSGSIVPTRTYESAGGRYCREYTQTITVDGWSERAYGTACRQPDGSWQIVE